MTRSILFFRAAAVLLLLFAAGHTFGFLTLVAPTPEARALRAAMDSTTFAIHGTTYSYGGFYLGFGLFISVFVLFSAAVAWRLGATARRASPDTRFLGSCLTVMMLVSVALGLRFFSAGPAVLSGLIALSAGAGTFFSAAAPSSSR